VSTQDGGSTTLGKSVVDEGADATRQSLNTLLGSDIQSTWRLDTPYLENLVDLVGDIVLDTDATVPGAKKGSDPLVTRGTQQTLNGQAAVAYATYRAPGEPQTRQLARFGQVLHAVLEKLSSNQSDATTTVTSLAQVLDPPLTEQQLGELLARLAQRAQSHQYDTMQLPVQSNGTLSSQATGNVVKSVLGGAVQNTAASTAPRISVSNAGAATGAASSAQITLVNGGFTVVSATETGGAPQPASRVTYAEAALATQAKDVAKTLGLPAGDVRKGTPASNADITVTLGGDYTPPTDDTTAG
jgi:anionic cell wall polymer biosynthesis LytR-Cps2A-Psr (LCP) family protein